LLDRLSLQTKYGVCRIKETNQNFALLCDLISYVSNASWWAWGFCI